MKLPRIIHKCCAITYDSYNIIDSDCFRAFKHKTTDKNYSYGITVRLVCRNNHCITSFTFLFDDENKIVKSFTAKGKNYLKRLQPFYIEPISMETEEIKIPKSDKLDNWLYVKGNKSGTGGNIYNFKQNKKIKTEYSSIKESNDNDKRNEQNPKT